MSTTSEIELARWQGSIDTKLEQLLAKVDEVADDKRRAHAAIHERLDSHHDRIDRVERWQDRALAAAMGVGIGAGFAGGGLVALLSRVLA